jgi:hypothetical protein
MSTKVHESEIQRAIVKALRWLLPNCIVFHVPNGGKRARAEAARLVAAGVLAGVPDLIVILPNQVVFIEVKTRKGVLSNEQDAFADKARELGQTCLIFRSAEDAIRWARNTGLAREGAVE